MMPFDESDPQEGEQPSDAPLDVGLEGDDGVEVDVPIELPQISPDTFNLAAEYRKTETGKRFLKRLSEQVLSEVQDDWDSSEEYRERRAVQHKLFLGNLDPKSFPFEESANVHLPLMIESLLRLHARGMAELYPSDGRIVYPIGTDRMDDDRRDRLSLHAEYQFRSEMPDFLPNQDRALLECWTSGSVFIHSYRDTANDRNCHDYLTCEDIILPYLWRTVDPSLGDVPRKTRVLRLYRHQLEKYQETGYYDGLEEVLDVTPSMDDPDKSPAKEEADRGEGREPPANDRQAPYKLYEYHGWLKLEGMGDRERPVKITVDTDTGTVIGLFVREEEDWRDKQRFEMEQAQYQAYLSERDAYADSVDQRQVMETLLADPNVAPEARAELEQQQASQQQMQPPEEVPEPKPVRMRVIEDFTHIVCIPNPLGSLGIGLGYLLEEFNKTADTVVSQFLDAATLANTVTGIASEAAKLGPGEIQLQPGKIMTSHLPPELIGNAVKIIQFPAANPQMMEVAMMMKDAAVGVASSPDVFSGEPGKANETWRGISTRVEQANKQLTMLMIRYIAGLTEVFRKNARLNAKFLPDSSYISVVDPEKRMQRKIHVARDDYAEDFDITFTADPRMTSQQQRISEADGIVAMIAQSTQFLGPAAPGMMWAALADAFRARRRSDMIQKMGPEPGPPEPPKPASPIEEDAGFLRGEDHPVLPEDDDEMHMMTHMQTLQSPDGSLLDKQGRDLLEKHIRFHAAQRMEKRAKGMNGDVQGPPGQAEPAGPGRLAQPPGDEGLFGRPS